jgi:hypothetical protein
MSDLSKYTARVTRHVAMELLCIDDPRVFRKVIDANPDLAHRLPGEKKAKYLRAVIDRLLQPENSRCATGTGGGKKKPKIEDRRSKIDGT